MKIWIFFFIVFSCNLAGFCQTDVQLKGKIIAGVTDETSIHILNITKNTGTTSGVNGSFEIRINLNDTLVISAVQYEKQEIIVTPEIYRDRFLTVVLTEGVNQMEEVNISNLGLTGRLNTDLDQIKTVNKYALGIPISTKPLPTQQERRIYTATSTSLDLLLNVLSGRLKKLKEEREISELMAMVRRAGEALPEDFFAEYLELSENDIVNFLYFCAENSDLRKELSTGNELALMEYFERMKIRYLDFKKG